MVSLISLFSFKWMQHSSLTISTVVLHCCMGLNICPFQPQKWLCSSGGWFLSIQGSSEAWKSLSIRHDILSAAAEPRGSPSFNIPGTRAGGRGSPVPRTWHRQTLALPEGERGCSRSLVIHHRKRWWSQLPQEQREALLSAPLREVLMQEET